MAENSWLTVDADSRGNAFAVLGESDTIDGVDAATRARWAAAGAVVLRDPGDACAAWWRERGARAVVLRPDRYLLGAAYVVTDVLKRGRVQKIDTALNEKYAAREYCVQYRETDHDFFNRLLEDDGIFYFYRRTETDHTIVLADSTKWGVVGLSSMAELSDAAVLITDTELSPSARQTLAESVGELMLVDPDVG